MNPSQIVPSDNKESDIFALARSIEGHLAENWEAVLQKNHEKLLDAYNRAGDMAYGTYCQLLFRPIHKQLKQAGLRPRPRFPGEFRIPRQPQVIALTETSKEAVVEALSHRSADFKNAREARIEIEEYLRNLQSQG